MHFFRPLADIWSKILILDKITASANARYQKDASAIGIYHNQLIQLLGKFFR
jgi:hypothetical protein